MADQIRFRLTDDHLKLLRRANIGWSDGEYGAPCIDCKRPYGSSNATVAIAKILAWDVPDEDTLPAREFDARMDELFDQAREIHRETQTALHIVLQSAGVGVEPGLYQLRDYRTWERVAD